MKRMLTIGVVLTLIVPTALAGKKDKTAVEDIGPLSASTFAGLKLRGLGPAINSGRVVDLAVTPGERQRSFVASASGGVWKTENAGTTWMPVFDKEASYSIGCVRIDPTNPNVVWVDTGESISQRVSLITDDLWFSTSAVTRTHRQAYAWAGEAFTTELGRLRKLFGDLEALEAKLEAAGAPWTPGRLPDWSLE